MISTVEEQAMDIIRTNPVLALAIAKVFKPARDKLALTSKQKEALDFIRMYSADNEGVAPSYEEIGAWLGLASKSGVHRLVTALEERGYLRREPLLARCIVLID